VGFIFSGTDREDSEEVALHRKPGAAAQSPTFRKISGDDDSAKIGEIVKPLHRLLAKAFGHNQRKTRQPTRTQVLYKRLSPPENKCGTNRISRKAHAANARAVMRRGGMSLSWSPMSPRCSSLRKR
jgi:hypothetical protein